MTLWDLMFMSDDQAEDWGEFRICIMLAGARCDNIKAVFNTVDGTVILTEDEES